MRDHAFQVRVHIVASWVAFASGFMILVASLIHVPASSSALNYFDPPKRLVFALLGVILCLHRPFRQDACRVRIITLSLGVALWMIARTLCRPHPGVEIGVLFTWLMPLLLFVLGLGVRRPVSAALWWTLVAAGIIQAVVMLLQRGGYDPFFGATTSLMEYTPGRMIGTIGYHNQAVDFLALCAAALFVVTRNLPLRLAGFAGLLVVGTLTASRGGIAASFMAVALGMTLSLVLDTQPSRKNRVGVRGVIICLGLGLATILVLPTSRQRILELAADFRASPAVGSRALMARIGLRLWWEKPVAGWGAGEYAYQYLDRLAAILPAEKDHALLQKLVFAREAHNDFIQFAAEFGLIGVALAAALIVLLLAAMWRARRSGPAAVCAMVFILAYMAVAGLVSFPWQTSAGGPLAGLLLGLLAPGVMGAEEWRERTHAVWVVLPRAFLLVLAVLMVGWYGLDARWNLAIADPAALRDPAAEASRLPRWAYPYHALLGAACASRGDSVQAEPILRHALDGYQDILLYNNLAHVYAAQGKWVDAATIYRRWVDTGLGQEMALYNLSVALENLGQLQEATDVLKSQWLKWPGDDAARAGRLGTLLLKTGRAREAIDVLRPYSVAPEYPAIQFRKRYSARGTSDQTPVKLSYVPVHLNRRETLLEIVLPDQRHVRIVGLTLVEGGAQRPVDLSRYFDYDGIAFPGEPIEPRNSFDGHGFSLPADDFPGDGIVSYSNSALCTFWQCGPLTGGFDNVVKAMGQGISVPTGRYERLDILCAAVDNPLPVRDTMSLVYTAGRDRQPFKVTDWCLPVSDSFGVSASEASTVVGLLGAAWLMEGNVAAAEPQLRRSLELDPTNMTASRNLAACRSHQTAEQPVPVPSQ